MPFPHFSRQAEPLLPLAVFLLAPLLLAAGVRRHAVQSEPATKSVTVPGDVAPSLPSAGGVHGR